MAILWMEKGIFDIPNPLPARALARPPSLLTDWLTPLTRTNGTICSALLPSLCLPRLMSLSE